MKEHWKPYHDEYTDDGNTKMWSNNDNSLYVIKYNHSGEYVVTNDAWYGCDDAYYTPIGTGFYVHDAIDSLREWCERERERIDTILNNLNRMDTELDGE